MQRIQSIPNTPNKPLLYSLHKSSPRAEFHSRLSHLPRNSISSNAGVIQEYLEQIPEFVLDLDGNQQDLQLLTVDVFSLGNLSFFITSNHLNFWSLLDQCKTSHSPIKLILAHLNYIITYSVGPERWIASLCLIQLLRLPNAHIYVSFPYFLFEKMCNLIKLDLEGEHDLLTLVDLTKELTQFVRERHFPGNHAPELLLKIANLYVDLLQTVSFHKQFNVENMTQVVESSVEILYQILTFYPSKDRTLVVYQGLLPVISLTTAPGEKINKWTLQCHDLVLDLFVRMSSEFEDPSLALNTQILLQNAFVQVASATATSRTHWLKGFETLLFSLTLPRPILSWITQAVTAKRSELRGFALETLTSLLPSEYLDSEIVLPLVLDRLSDASNPVRTRAMQMLITHEKLFFRQWMALQDWDALLSCSQETNAHVRRTSIQLMHLLIKYEMDTSSQVTSLVYTQPLLKMILDRCRDVAINTRKQAIGALDELTRFAVEWEWLWKKWFETLCWTSFDSENALALDAAQKLNDAVDAMLKNSSPQITRNLLACVQDLDPELDLGMKKLAMLLDDEITSKQVQKLGQQAFSMLQNADPLTEAAWRWYRCWSNGKYLDTKGLIQSWQVWWHTRESLTSSENIACHVLELVSTVKNETIQKDIEQVLLKFELYPACITPALSCLFKDKKLPEFTLSGLYFACEQVLEVKTMLSKQDYTEEDVARIIRATVTASSLAQISKVPDWVVVSLQTLLATHHEVLTPARAQALVALGKLSIQNDEIAKRVFPAFRRELETSNDAVIRNNAVVVLCDICRYAKSEAFITSLTNRLGDESVIVRRQTLQGITRLLQEEYIKISTGVFLKLLTRVHDEVADIRNLAEYALTEVILKRHPNAFVTYFIDALFFLNDHRDSRVVQLWFSQRDEKVLTMPGIEGLRKRQNVYRFLLLYLSDSQKLELRSKLTMDVLVATRNGQVNLVPTSGQAVLQDCLWILTSKEMSISTSLREAKSQVVEEEDVEMEKQAKLLKKIDGQVKTKISKALVIEQLVPALVELKLYLEQVRSPLLRNVMQALRDVCKEFPSEVKNVMLTSGTKLASELEFDLREDARAKVKPVLEPSSPQVSVPAVKQLHGPSKLRQAFDEDAWKEDENLDPLLM